MNSKISQKTDLGKDQITFITFLYVSLVQL